MRRATQVIPADGSGRDASVRRTVSLTYKDRFRRRIRMQADDGSEFLLDLREARALRDGDLLRLDDHSLVRVTALPEPVLRITAPDPRTLMRIAWHIGNRHLAAEIHPDYLLIADDHVIAEMVSGLGGAAERHELPFQPEGGAYAHEH